MHNYLDAFVCIDFGDGKPFIVESPDYFQTIDEAKLWADSVFEESSRSSKKYGKFELNVVRVYVGDESILTGKNICVDWKPKKPKKPREQRSKNDDL